MHKDIYASGFLYHPGSQQILLQQLNSDKQNCFWSLSGEKVIKSKTGEETFKQIFYEKLSLKLKLSNIHFVYAYFSEEKSKDYNVYYAEVKKLHKFSESKKTTFAWFNFKQIHKLNLTEQTKHDIIVAQRVIDSSVRKSLGLRTIG